MKKIILAITLVLFTFVSFNIVLGDTLAQETQFNNITVFVRFNDETDYSAPFDYTYYDSMLNSTDSVSLKNYYLEVSYGSLTIDSFIPNVAGDIIFYTDTYERSYFEPYSTENPDGVTDSGQADREHGLIQRALDYVDTNDLVPDEMDLDVNLDGMIDSITFMVSGEDSGWSSLLWPHKWELYTFYNYSTESFTYDPNGNLIKTKSDCITVNQVFDEENFLVREEQGDVTVTSKYDASGNRIRRTSSFGNEIEYRYDAMDNVKAISINGSDAINIKRDARGFTEKEILSQRLKRSYQYDSDGLLISQNINNGKNIIIQREYEYDATGNLTKRIDSNKGVTVFNYDPLGRVIKHINPEGKIKQFLYDLSGNLLKNQNTRNIDWTYEVLGIETTEYATWWDSSWKKKQEIILTNNRGNITDFTKFLNVSFKTGMNTDFSDIRFLDSGELTELAFEKIKIIDSNSAQVFVKLNNFNLGNNTIYIYFDNPGASDGDNVANLYSDYISIFHLENNTNGGMGLETITNTNYTAVGSPTTADGYFGQGIDVSNNGQYIQLGNYQGLTDLWNYTIIGVGKADNIDLLNRLFRSRDAETSRDIAGFISGSNLGNKISNRMDNSDLISTESVSTSDYYIYVARKTDQVRSIFVNDTKDSGAYTVKTFNVATDTRIGDGYDANQGWNGKIGELWISNKSFSDAAKNAVVESAKTVKKIRKDDLVNFTAYNTTSIQNLTIFKNVDNLAEDNHNWTCKGCNSFGCEKLSVRNFNIDTTPNIIFINSTPENNETITENNFNINVSLTETYFQNITFRIFNASNYNIVTSTFTDSTREFNSGNLTNGIYNYSVNTATTTGKENSTEQRKITIYTTAPTINITEPVGQIDSFILGDNQSLSWQVTEPGQNPIGHITNCSYIYNEIETQLNLTQCLETNTTSFLYVSGVNNLTFTATDNFGLVGTDFTSWNYLLLELNQTFNNQTIEGNQEEFRADLIVDGDIISEAIFNYNNTNYTTNIFSSGEDYIITSSVVVPPVEAEINISFLFYVNIGGQTYSLTSNNQSVGNVNISVCSPGDNLLLNMSLKDEITKSNMFGTIEINTQVISKTSGEIVASANTNFSNISSGAICLNPIESFSDLYLDAEIKYYSDDYAPELYYIQTADISDYPKNLSLFDLNSTFSTNFIITYQDDNLITISEAVIQLQKKYINEGESVVRIKEDYELFLIL